MSNHLAIATVTASLCQLLQEAVDVDAPVVTGAKVTNDRPNQLESNQTPGVNVFLYQVTPNAAWRNTDLPTRRGNGADILNRPRIALDLHYLMSFHGDEAELQPQRLLGSVARILHTKPILDRQRIRNLVSKPSFSFLKGSDLAEDVEQVRFTPAGLTLEELSKLWSVVFQTPYFLSAAYQASVVLIESDDTALTPLPVKERNVQAYGLQRPTIDEVLSLDHQGRAQPIVSGSTLTIRGSELRGELTEVLLNGHPIAPSLVTPTQIQVPLAPTSVSAGVQSVQVVQSIAVNRSFRDISNPPVQTPHRAVESNLAPFVLRPTITPGIISTVVDPGKPTIVKIPLAVQPAVHVGQRVGLLLNKINASPPLAYSFSLKPLPTADTSNITFDTTGIVPGSYLVRLLVDGADSPLDLDAASPAFGPKVTVPV